MPGVWMLHERTAPVLRLLPDGAAASHIIHWQESG